MPTTLMTPLRRFGQVCRAQPVLRQTSSPSATAALPPRLTYTQAMQRAFGAVLAFAKRASNGSTLGALAAVTIARAAFLPVLSMTFALTDGLLVVAATVLDVAIAALALLAWSLATNERAALDSLRKTIDERRDQAAPLSLAENGPASVAGLAKAINSNERGLKVRITEQLDFQAALAHDLRTPLTRIGLRCENVAEERLRAAIRRDLSEVDALVEDCLACCRAQRGVGESRRHVHLDSLLESLVCDYQDSGSTVALEGRVGRSVMIRPVALRRVLVNLVDNALRYGNQVRVRVHVAEDRLVLAILDSGPGIAPEELEAVLAPWYRAARGSERATGSGLGLAIARRLTQSMDGHLHLENRKSGGLEARLTLPLLLA